MDFAALPTFAPAAPFLQGGLAGLFVLHIGLSSLRAAARMRAGGGCGRRRDDRGAGPQTGNPAPAAAMRDGTLRSEYARSRSAPHAAPKPATAGVLLCAGIGTIAARGMRCAAHTTGGRP